MDLFEEKRKNENHNAFIFFQNGKKISVKAFGKNCLIGGYLSFIDGVFSVKELQDNCNEKQIFITDCVDVEIGNIEKKKQCICIAENFFYDNEIFTNKNSVEDNLRKKDITLICNFQLENISHLINNDNCYKTLNNIKCVLYFPEDNDTTDENMDKIINILKEMPDTINNIDFLKQYKTFNPYCIKNLPNDNFYNDELEICKNRQKVGIIDFGITEYLLNILQKYFEIKMLPIIETAEHIGYLYEDGKIDGLIFSNSLCNTSFVNSIVFNEMKKVVNSNIPKLGIEFGACFIAEILGTTTKNISDIYYYDNFMIKDDKNKLFRVSGCYNKQIEGLSLQLKANYFDENNNVIGFKNSDKNIIGYNFSFFSNSADTMYFLNNFYKMIKNKNKKRKIL